MPTFPLARLGGFRAELHACFTRRTDALFELGDALLCAQAVPSLPHLSLEPVHRRGWGSAYAALARGRIDAERLRDLLAGSLPPADGLVFAVGHPGPQRPPDRPSPILHAADLSRRPAPAPPGLNHKLRPPRLLQD
ncbi:MAG: transposase [Actinomycetota bacterium]|nr:transposase [Actinomycetota bacterium]